MNPTDTEYQEYYADYIDNDFDKDDYDPVGDINDFQIVSTAYTIYTLFYSSQKIKCFETDFWKLPRGLNPQGLNKMKRGIIISSSKFAQNLGSELSTDNKKNI